MISETLLPLLRCPITGSSLELTDEGLVNANGTVYPIIQGVPVLLPPNDDPTLWVASASYAAAREGRADDDYYEDTIGILPEHLKTIQARLKDPSVREGAVDPLISFLVRATCGFMYEDQVGTLKQVPIPEMRLPRGEGLLLDIGCNWGRWCVAAARRGYRPVGLDPSLGAVLAAKRLCRSLGVEAEFVVGDACVLPLSGGSFDRVFSYSVLQHFSYEDAHRAVEESARVAKAGGELMVQMPNLLGVRCLYHQARRGFRSADGFEVRYYSPGHLRRLFRQFGDSTLEVDGFFGLGIQPGDRHLLPRSKRVIVDSSEVLRKTASWVPPLKYFADSLYVRSRRPQADA